MYWVVQENIFKEQAYDEFLHQLARLSIPHSVHKVVPFVGELEPDIILGRTNVIVWGSYSMRHVAKKKGWKPGSFSMEHAQWLEQMKSPWAKYLLNADAKLSRFRDVHPVSPSDPLFIRPYEDSKTFAGMVIYPREFREWQNKVLVLGEDDGSTLTGDTMVLSAPPKTIRAEYRFWIVEGRVITGSLYKRGDTVVYEEVYQSHHNKAHSFALAMVSSMSTDKWNPAGAFVLDIADTDDGFKIVEAQNINSAGLYAADVQRLIMALEDYGNRTKFI